MTICFLSSIADIFLSNQVIKNFELTLKHTILKFKRTKPILTENEISRLIIGCAFVVN